MNRFHWPLALTLAAALCVVGLLSLIYVPAADDPASPVAAIRWVTASILMAGAGGIVLLARELARRQRSEATLGERCSELVRAEEAAEVEKKAAEAATQAKSAFLSSMSHEIRTPLNGVFGMTNLLLRSDLDERQHEWVETLRRSCDNLQVIVNDILDLSKIEAGALQLERRSFDLPQLLEQLLEPFAVEAERRGLRLVSSFDPKTPRWLVGDATRLGQVLTNLVSNALKFTYHGEITVTAAPRYERDGEVEMLFHVRDTGVGIPAEKQGKLFQAFAQAEASTARRFGGSGLGLMISRNLVELMGGKIWVESEAGQGSSFYFTIVATVAEGGTVIETGGEAAVELSPDFARFFPLSILVAEDDAINRQVIGETLHTLGYEPRFATDGAEALAELAARSFDLLLLDLHMPVLDGFEVANRLKVNPPATGRPRIVALTARATRDVREKCFEAGMDDYLTKPFPLHELQRLLRGEEGMASGAIWTAQIETGMPTLEVRAVEKLKKLKAGKRHEVLRELVEMFREMTPERLASMRESFDRGDTRGVQEMAHMLKSNAGNLGARKMAFVCATIEEAAAEGDLSEVKELLGPLEVLFNRSIRALSATVAKPPAETQPVAPGP